MKRHSMVQCLRLAGVLAAIAAGLNVQPASAQESEKDPNEYVQRVMIADANGDHLGILTNIPGYTHSGSPAWSADSQMIAFDAWKGGLGETYVKAQIVVAPLNGSEPRILGDGAMPSFSPDGTHLVYSRYSPNYGIWVQRIDEEGHPPQLIASDGWCGRWSPDGTCISFTAYEGGKHNICLQTIADGSRRFLFPTNTDHPYRTVYWNYSWSADGKLISGAADTPDGKREIYTITTSTDAPVITRHQFSPLGSRVTFTPDGKLMFGLERDKKQQMYTLDFQNMDAEPVPFPCPPGYKVSIGEMSPDGKLVAFIMVAPLPEFARR